MVFILYPIFLTLFFTAQKCNSMQKYNSNLIAPIKSSDAKFVSCFADKTFAIIKNKELKVYDSYDKITLSCYVYKNSLNFSCDENKIFLITKDKCLKLKTPYEILSDNKAYLLSTRQKCVFFSFFLKQKEYLPNDIKTILIKLLINTCKY